MDLWRCMESSANMKRVEQESGNSWIVNWCTVNFNMTHKSLIEAETLCSIHTCFGMRCVLGLSWGPPQASTVSNTSSCFVLNQIEFFIGANIHVYECERQGWLFVCLLDFNRAAQSNSRKGIQKGKVYILATRDETRAVLKDKKNNKKWWIFDGAWKALRIWWE